MRRSSPLAPTVEYDFRTGRFADKATGRFVSGARVRAELDTYLDNAGKAAIASTAALRGGKIDLGTWQAQMARSIKSIHVASATLARGGFQQMSPAAYGTVGRQIRDQYAYLANFAGQIASGAQLLDGTLSRRAALYVQAGRATYHATERAEQQKRGRTEERNLLAPADHCTGCVGETARGWVAIGSLVPVGQRICRVACRCGVEYR